MTNVRLVTIAYGTSDELIKCTRQSATIESTVYTAISYEWGSAEQSNLIPILLNGVQFDVTRNLHAFLVAARESKVDNRLWIDAICINQESIAEREEQVKLMRRIYSNAEQVWVWLGAQYIAPSVSLSHLFDLSKTTKIRDRSERARMKLEELRREQNPTILEPILSICSQSYWNRVWIIQEFLTAKYIRIWAGNHIIDGEDFKAMLFECTDPGFLYPPRSFREHIAATSAGKLCAILQGHRKRLGQRTHPDFRPSELPIFEQSITQALILTSTAMCSDWHDHVYGILALFGRSYTSLPVDYSRSKVEVLMDVFHAERGFVIGLEAARMLKERLLISDEELLNHLSSNTENDRHLALSDASLELVGVVDRVSSTKPGQWIFIPQTNFVIPDDPVIGTIEPCECSKCSKEGLSPILSGDQIYGLQTTEGKRIKYVWFNTFNGKRTRNSMQPVTRLDNQSAKSNSKDGSCKSVILYETYILLRHTRSSASGLKYIGALSGKETTLHLLMHCLPPLALPYDLHHHLSHDSCHMDKTLLQLEINPPTLCFLLRTLTAVDRMNSDAQRTNYRWLHKANSLTTERSILWRIGPSFIT